MAEVQLTGRVIKRTGVSPAGQEKTYLVVEVGEESYLIPYSLDTAPDSKRIKSHLLLHRIVSGEVEQVGTVKFAESSFI